MLLECFKHALQAQTQKRGYDVEIAPHMVDLFQV